MVTTIAIWKQDIIKVLIYCCVRCTRTYGLYALLYISNIFSDRTLTLPDTGKEYIRLSFFRAVCVFQPLIPGLS